MKIDDERYAEKVYAGVLGKIIGVYLGRPFEGWLHRDIVRKFGAIETYVHEVMGVPLVVTDDDISGTFTFVRALEEHGYPTEITPNQIGRTWLNTIIENRSILWWGGFGRSTEHTAYLRLKEGVPAPRSGSAELNGRTVAEQIGAQIFIDGWGLISPGDPARAADFARRAGSVSHDGEAIHGAQMVAAMVAQAFVDSDIDRLIDAGLQTIPEDCRIARLIADIRAWHRTDSRDWEANFHRIEQQYGYDRYGGGCHMIPNHALIILALLHGRGDFQESLKIVNTCGWDTDCNSGNVGCILGVMGGLEGLESGVDFRGPVADRILLPQADGGRAITDAVRESIALVQIAQTLKNETPVRPADGARFHFAFPGSVQGFQPVEDHTNRGRLRLKNDLLPGSKTRSLAFQYRGLATGCAVHGATPTWLTPDDFKMPGYALDACPTLYPGQTVTARVMADPANERPVQVSLALQAHGETEALTRVTQAPTELAPGDRRILTWTVPETGGHPIATIGLELSARQRTDGTLYLESLDWEGAPDLSLDLPKRSSPALKAWIRDTENFERVWGGDAIDMIAWDRRGLAYTGTREWTDIRFAATLEAKLADSFGLLARVQGLRRYYAFELVGGQTARLLKMRDEPTVLAEVPFAWQNATDYRLELVVSGATIRASIDGRTMIEIEDTDQPLADGAVGLTATRGKFTAREIEVRPSKADPAGDAQ